MAPTDSLTQTHHRTPTRLASLAMLAAVSLLSGCATNYDSAGNQYYSFWPFIGSRNPELQLNYPAQNPRSLQLGQDPDPFYLISPQPPVDPRVTSPYSQVPADPDARLATVSDNAACADRCESKEAVGRAMLEGGAPPALRADARDSRSTD
ncbi:MAG: hypothetical protein ABI569_16340 [Casimicrobiaceae bacterium]